MSYPLSGGKLSREQLDRYQWSAADILLGAIGSSDYKNFIFGLLFLKRLSDRFEEECEDHRKEKADHEDPDEHQLFVPKAARWTEIQKSATGVGEALNQSPSRPEDESTLTEEFHAAADCIDAQMLSNARRI
jgi:type I restriction enzyme M protein